MTLPTDLELSCLDHQIQIRNLIYGHHFQALHHQNGNLVPYVANTKQRMRFILVDEGYKAHQIPGVSWVANKLGLGHFATISIDVTGNNDMTVVTLHNPEHLKVIEAMLHDIAPILGLDPSRMNIHFAYSK